VVSVSRLTSAIAAQEVSKSIEKFAAWAGIFVNRTQQMSRMENRDTSFFFMEIFPPM
jgi:hypothetical protein